MHIVVVESILSTMPLKKSWIFSRKDTRDVIIWDRLGSCMLPNNQNVQPGEVKTCLKYKSYLSESTSNPCMAIVLNSKQNTPKQAADATNYFLSISPVNDPDEVELNSQLNAMWSNWMLWLSWSTFPSFAWSFIKTLMLKQKANTQKKTTGQ